MRRNFPTMTKHPEPRSRSLFFALGFSLLLHALLLAGAPHLRPLRLEAPGTVIRAVINRVDAPADDPGENVLGEKTPPVTRPAPTRPPPALMPLRMLPLKTKTAKKRPQ